MPLSYQDLFLMFNITDQSYPELTEVLQTIDIQFQYLTMIILISIINNDRWRILSGIIELKWSSSTEMFSQLEN